MEELIFLWEDSGRFSRKILGATINILTTKTCKTLGIQDLEPSTNLLKLADHSVVRPEGTL